eukprot:SAG31_NODE_198_length_20656_cov_5.167291_7_plen_162_part_00
MLLSRFCGTFLVFVGLIEKYGTNRESTVALQGCTERRGTTGLRCVLWFRCLCCTREVASAIILAIDISHFASAHIDTGVSQLGNFEKFFELARASGADEISDGNDATLGNSSLGLADTARAALGVARANANFDAFTRVLQTNDLDTLLAWRNRRIPLQPPA